MPISKLAYKHDKPINKFSQKDLDETFASFKECFGILEFLKIQLKYLPTSENKKFIVNQIETFINQFEEEKAYEVALKLFGIESFDREGKYTMPNFKNMVEVLQLNVFPVLPWDLNFGSLYKDLNESRYTELTEDARSLITAENDFSAIFSSEDSLHLAIIQRMRQGFLSTRSSEIYEIYSNICIAEKLEIKTTSREPNEKTTSKSLHVKSKLKVRNLFDTYYKKIKSTIAEDEYQQPKNPDLDWYRLISQAIQLRDNIIIFREQEIQLLQLYQLEKDDLLYKEIEIFLKKNNFNHRSLPKQKEIEEKPGGQGLLKKTAKIGKYRDIDAQYQKWILKNSDNIANTYEKKTTGQAG
tara:strand:- start:103 stop:1167 length:1065 start_codon:yes stop_codon:yes gene_type:complete